MPIIFDIEEKKSIEIEDFYKELDYLGNKIFFEENRIRVATLLKRLFLNRHFLEEYIRSEVNNFALNQYNMNDYSSQVLVLRKTDNYLLRVSCWPGTNSIAMKENHKSSFFYDYAHDHNFSFYTLGYSGPGYITKMAEYKYSDATGARGENIAMTNEQCLQLSEGQVWLYRAHQDIHTQIAPEHTSISINILEGGNHVFFKDQYEFDMSRKKINKIIGLSTLDPFIALAPFFGGNLTEEMLFTFANDHPSDRIRILSEHSLYKRRLYKS